MDDEARIKALLDEVFRSDPEHRTQYVIDFLETMRGEDPGRGQEPHPEGATATGDDLDDLAPGDQIGVFRVESRIATGGMGAVYRAQQLSPFERPVALKALRVDLHSPEAIARFEIERQALALMNHPNIAQIYEGGITESGRPYFAMEFVEGAPLLDHCDREQLSLPARVHLFASICDAVQHAHQKGILHRDLKPSNILVTRAGVPKVIDFGIAKSMDPLPDSQVTTGGYILGTAHYMSPEQLVGSPDLDTQTDVFSLGVVLFELLVGALPTTAETYLALREQVCAQPPKGLRAAFDALSGEEQARVASARSAGVASHRRSLRGEVTTILFKALARERKDRYATAHDLATDLRRLLRREPLLARKPTFLYSSQKFVRRHKAVSALLLGFLVALTSAFVTTRKMLIQERESVDAVGELLDDRPELAGHYYLALSDVFRSKHQNRRRSIDAAEKASAYFEESDSLGWVEARQMRNTLLVEGAGSPFEALPSMSPLQKALAYHNLGDYELGEAHYRIAYEDPTTPRVGYLALLLRDAGRLEEARLLIEDLIERFPHTDDPLRRATLHWCKGSVWGSRGQPRLALEALREAKALFEAHGSPEQVAAVQTDVLNLLETLPRSELTSPEARAVSAGPPPETPASQPVVSDRNTGRDLARAGRNHEAEERLLRSIEGAEELGDGDVQLIHSLCVLAQLEIDRGASDQAEARLARALELAIDRRASTAGVLLVLARLYIVSGRPDPALEALQLAVRDRSNAPRLAQHRTRATLARALEECGRTAAARQEFDLILSQEPSPHLPKQFYEDLGRERAALAEKPSSPR